MKRTLLTLAIVAVSMAAFAQGSVDFANDSLHLVYFTADTARLCQGDAGLALQGMSASTVLAGSPTIVADLWAGTSSGSLHWEKTVSTWSVAPGRWTATQVMLDIPGNTLDWFQITVHDSRISGADPASLQANALASPDLYYGWSAIFATIPANLAPGTPLYSSAAGLPPGTRDLSATCGAGARGSLMLLANVPEPSAAGLAAFSAAAMMALRRRR